MIVRRAAQYSEHKLGDDMDAGHKVDSLPFRISICLEELGIDLERALAVASDLGIQDVDFGSLWGQRVDRVPLRRLVQARDLLRQYEMRVRVVGPSTFKTVRLEGVPLEHIAQEPAFQKEMLLLRAQLEAARFFGAPLSRIYSFRRTGMIGLGNPSLRLPQGGPFPEEMQAKVARALSLACLAAQDAGVVLALENVRSCWGNSGHNTALIAKRVNSPWLKVIWDPANAWVCGEEDLEAGYQAIRPYLAHVHLKDAALEDADSGLTRWERMGDGEVDLAGQLAALRRDGYDGCLSVETHWSPPGGNKEWNTRRTHAGLIELLVHLR